MILLAFICGTLCLVWSVYAFFAYRPRRIAGTTVVVTGACSEVGRRLCLQLYARGARVIAWDYSRVKLQELQTEVLRATTGAADTLDMKSNAESASGASAAAVSGGSSGADDFIITAVDASSRLQVQRAAREIEGRVDILINAAHSYPSKSLSERADDSIDRVFQTNLISPLVVLRQLLPSLLTCASPPTPTGKGSSNTARKDSRRRDDYAQVVNIVGAAASYTVAPECPEYAASQWGVVGMHYSMRAWLAQERAEFAAGRGCSSTAKAASPSATLSPAAAGGSPRGGGGAGVPQPSREVRTTLLCLDEVQLGIPTALSSQLAPASTMTGAGALSSAAAGTAAGRQNSSPDRDGLRGASATREGYAQALQKRNADLDRAVACCVGAICRGQERYCYSSSWRTAFLYPIAMMCPVPWAERLLRWGQRAPVAGAASES